MVAARDARGLLSLSGLSYDDVIKSIDWNRVLIQAKGLHMTCNHPEPEVCGQCILAILLRHNE